MDIYTFLVLAFAFPYIAIATPLSEWQKNGGLGNFKTANITGNSTANGYHGILANLTSPGDGKDIYDDIREYNRRHPENQIADLYICPHPLVLASLLNSVAVYEALQQAIWFQQHPNEERPHWNGMHYPSTIDPYEYFARIVDLGNVVGPPVSFPVYPMPTGAWPGLPGAPVLGPPGNIRVLLDEAGTFAGLVVLWYGHEGQDLVWCYPVDTHGWRDTGATGENVPGVDEALRDNYDGFHFVDVMNPQWGSHPRFDGFF